MFLGGKSLMYDISPLGGFFVRLSPPSQLLEIPIRKHILVSLKLWYNKNSDVLQVML